MLLPCDEVKLYHEDMVRQLLLVLMW